MGAVTSLRIELIGDPSVLEPWYDAAGSQKDNLCGAYWADIAVQAFTSHRFVDEEDAALVAGSVVPEGQTDPRVSFPWQGVGPGGVIVPSWPYRLALPSSADGDALGTSADGVKRAIEDLSVGELAVLPVQHPRWTAGLVVDLIDALANLDAKKLLAIANIDTASFQTSRHSLADLLASVWAGRRLPSRPGDWSVGHFASLAGVIHGPADELVIVRDTYRQMGSRGYHLQPPTDVAAALDRDGTSAGGILLVAPPADLERLRSAITPFELIEHLWDNGSPAPPNGAAKSVSAP